MSSIPVWLRLAFAALLLITIAVAFVGRPPRRHPGRRTWRRLAGVGAACYGIGCGALLLMHDPALSAVLVGVGVETLSVVAWLGRGLGDEGDGEEGGGPDRGTDPPGGIWDDEDDRAFWRYVDHRGRSGPRVTTPV